MKPTRRVDSGTTWRWWIVPAAVCLVGCKSDLNQQLLERELRYQEDQIYQLQDELQEKCARLERTAGENASLRRQLGVSDTDPAAAPRRAPGRPRPATAAPVPPANSIPDAGSAAPRAPVNSGPPVELAPPVLDNVPPLPANGGANAAPANPIQPVADGGLDLPPPSPAAFDPAARPVDAAGAAESPAGRQLSFAAGLTGTGRATRLVVNPAQTACIDANGDGVSEQLAVVVEPRTDEERMVAPAGDVAITVFDAAQGEGPPIAEWLIPAAEAATSFRPTSRTRGMQFALPWPGQPPAGPHVRVAVRLAVPDGPPLEADATIPIR